MDVLGVRNGDNTQSLEDGDKQCLAVGLNVEISQLSALLRLLIQFRMPLEA